MLLHYTRLSLPPKTRLLQVKSLFFFFVPASLMIVIAKLHARFSVAKFGLCMTWYSVAEREYFQARSSSEGFAHGSFTRQGSPVVEPNNPNPNPNPNANPNPNRKPYHATLTCRGCLPLSRSEKKCYSLLLPSAE